jgi:hypothetical protein
MEDEMRHSARNVVSGVAALFLLGGTVLGVLCFGLMAILGYAHRRYEFALIGIAGLGGIVGGLYAFFHPPAA